jgi:DNA-binding response OmpR family regulator
MTGWKKRILIVDDEPDVIFTLKKGLEQEGFPDIFSDPLEALSYFEAGQREVRCMCVYQDFVNGILMSPSSLFSSYLIFSHK